MKFNDLKKAWKRMLTLALAAALAVSGTAASEIMYVQASETESTSAPKSNADGAVVAAGTVEALQAIDYLNNAAIEDLLAPTRYTTVEKLNKKTEIFKRDGIAFADITDEMVLTELNKDNLQIMSYQDAFERVQADLNEIIPKVVRNSYAWTAEDESEYFITTIKANQEEFLLGLAYLYRLYDFQIGDMNIKDMLLENPDYFGLDVDLLEWLKVLGGAGGETFKLVNNQSAFANYFTGNVTNSTSLTSFLETEIGKVENLSADQWFKDASNAIIIEQSTESNPSATVALYSKLKNDSTLTRYILPLLNVSENSVYVISNQATITLGLVDTYVNRSNRANNETVYQAEVDEFKTTLGKTAEAQAGFLDLMYRVAKDEDRAELQSNRLVVDSMRIKQSTTATASAEWSAKFGETASLGVREFFTPMNLYVTFVSASAQAEGTGMRYFMAKAATDEGLSTYAHELTHLLVDGVWLNNYGSREGLDAEFFPRGLYESYYDTDPVMNLNFVYDYSGAADRIYNQTPERFRTAEDLQQYAKGMMDVIYTLDYLEAQAVLEKDAAAKQEWYHKYSQVADTRTRFNQGNASAVHTIDSISTITLEEAEELVTWEDLVEQNMVASRYEIQGLMTTGTAASNGYHIVPLFTANYSSAQNDNGVSGDVVTRRQAYEMLAEYGYYEGMVPYISNQYLQDATNEGQILSDTYIFDKIFGAEYASMVDFKKAMFTKRIDKLDELKEITITYDNETIQITSVLQLEELMAEAVAYDQENVQLTDYGWNNIRAQYTKVELLKKAVYTAYLTLTDDFTVSIYAEAQEPEPTTPVTEVFSDVSTNEWYVDCVQYVYDNGIMSGSNGLFKPTGSITRAQVVSTLYRLEDSPVITDYSACTELTDVSCNAWYTDAVCWAYSTGVGTGNSTTKKFNVTAPVTRQQLASFFYRYAQYKGMNTTASADLSNLVNADKVESYAATAVKWAVGVGIISGSKTTDSAGNTVYDLKPTGTATRAQMATILQRFCEEYHI